MNWFYRVAYAIFRVIFQIFFRIKVVGAENIPEKDGFLVCSNHFSATDPIKVCIAFKGHQICYMAKKELFKIPIFNLVIKAFGAFPVDRSKADVGAIKHMLHLLESGRDGGMFPQGTRHPEKDPRDTALKPGAGMICARTRATVVPVFIGQKNFRHKNFVPTTVIIGKPISFEEMNYQQGVKGEYARMSAIIFDRVCKLGVENGFLEKR